MSCGGGLLSYANEVHKQDVARDICLILAVNYPVVGVPLTLWQ